MPTTNKTKATLKRLDAALTAFHSRYSSPDQFGEQRWKNHLLPALVQPTAHAALINAFGDTHAVLQLFKDAGIDDEELRQLDMSNASGTETQPIDDTGHVLTSPYIVCFERIAVASSRHDNSDQPRKDAHAVLPFPVPARVWSSMPGGHELLSHWNMDPASILAASLLEVRPGDRVLDFCSAPGGKSIVLSHSLFPYLHDNQRSVRDQLSSDVLTRTCLHCNEIDSQRNKRLEANLQAYLPTSLLTSKTIRVLQIDGAAKAAVAALPHGLAGYDKVLIDAPCSSERHILHAHTKATQSGQIAEEMLNWKPSHSNTLAKTQVGLLTNGLLAARVGGRVVYATCALGREENDLVIETVLHNIKKERKREKASGKGNSWSWDLEFATVEGGTGLYVDAQILEEKTEQTQFGRIALPDKGGWGPLYFCVIKKVARKRRSKKHLQDEHGEESLGSTKQDFST